MTEFPVATGRSFQIILGQANQNFGKHLVERIVLVDQRRDKKGRKRGQVFYDVFWYERGPHKEEIFQGTGSPRVYADPKYAEKIARAILKAQR